MSKILNPEQAKYLESFIKKGDSLITEMEAYAGENKIPILSRDSAVLLEQLVIMLKPKRVLELGTAIAYSSIRIARCLGNKGTVHTIEKSKDNIKIAKSNIKKSGLVDKIKLIEGNALDILPELEKKYDLIFLDADKTDYKTLFQYASGLLRKNGVLFVDNLLWHGYAAAENVPQSYKESARLIREFNDMFCSNPKLKTSILPVGDGIGIGIKINKQDRI